jgi:SM-20-related protein
MFDPNSIQVHDKVIPEDLFTRLLAVSKNLSWQFGWFTPSNRSARYWHHEVGHGGKMNDKCVANEVRKHPLEVFSDYQDWLLSQLPADSRIIRYYLNAHTYGTDGWPHVDTKKSGQVTALLFFNQQWKSGWGGETVIFGEDGDIRNAILPATNRILSFPSHWLHAPRPLSKAFNGLRIVLVVKIGFADS